MRVQRQRDAGDVRDDVVYQVPCIYVQLIAPFIDFRADACFRRWCV